MGAGTIVLLVLAALIVFILVRNIRIVPQAQAYVVTRLGPATDSGGVLGL